MTCAIAAALAEMVASFQGETGAAADAAARAAAARRRALELAQLDLASYRPVLEALRLPAGDPGRAAAVSAALADAADVPFELAELAAAIATMAAELALHASLHVVSDASNAAVLAEAACRSAALLVEVNLRATADPRIHSAVELTRTAAAARERALAAAGSA